MPTHEVTCPYCGNQALVEHPESYAPTYEECRHCGRKYIFEPLTSGVAAYKLGEAPGWSDPDARETDAAAHDEQ